MLAARNQAKGWGRQWNLVSSGRRYLLPGARVRRVEVVQDLLQVQLLHGRGEGAEVPAGGWRRRQVAQPAVLEAVLDEVQDGPLRLGRGLGAGHGGGLAQGRAQQQQQGCLQGDHHGLVLRGSSRTHS